MRREQLPRRPEVSVLAKKGVFDSRGLHGAIGSAFSSLFLFRLSRRGADARISHGVWWEAFQTRTKFVGLRRQMFGFLGMSLLFLLHFVFFRACLYGEAHVGVRLHLVVLACGYFFFVYVAACFCGASLSVLL